MVKTIRTDIEGVASTSSDLLPYGKFRIVESEAPDGYLTDGAKPIDFAMTENGKIVDLTDEAHSIYNQIKRGDIEGVKIGAGTHKRLANVPFRITSKTTGENHVVVTDDNGQFSTSAEWASHKHNTNAGKTSEDGVWFGTSEPDDSKGALPYDTYIIEELRSESNKGCLDAFYPSTNPQEFWKSVRKIQSLKISRILPGHHHLSIPVTIIDKIETAFHNLSNEGKLKQGNGIFSYEGFQIHI